MLGVDQEMVQSGEGPGDLKGRMEEGYKGSGIPGTGKVLFIVESGPHEHLHLHREEEKNDSSRCTYRIADHRRLHALPVWPSKHILFNKPPRHLQASSYQTGIPPMKSVLDTELFSRSGDGIRSLL